MKTETKTIIITGVLSFLSFALVAQNDNDYTNNRGDNNKKQSRDAINTNEETPVKIIEYIVGKWDVQGIYKGKKDITDTDTVGSDRTIEFDRDGRYVISTGNGTADNGSYRLNENHSILYLQSETSDNVTEWKISLNDEGLMTLQPTGTHPHAESFRYVYSKTSAADRNTDQEN